MNFSRKLYSALHLFQVNLRYPLFRRVLNRLIAFTCPRAGVSPVEIFNHTASLRENGYVNLTFLFDSLSLSRLRDELMIRDCFDPWNRSFGSFRLIDAPLEAHTANVLQAESISEAMAIANHPGIIAIVSEYLRCKPTISSIQAWWSFSGRAAPKEAQFFHRDNESARFLKLFIYLSDVSVGNGPHVFVRKSHQLPMLLQKRRYRDAEVLSRFSREDVISFVGPFGTAFLEDTYGIHKGQLPVSGDRLIFQVTYATMPSPSSFWDTTVADISGYDKYINRLLARVSTP